MAVAFTTTTTTTCDDHHHHQYQVVTGDHHHHCVVIIVSSFVVLLTSSQSLFLWQSVCWRWCSFILSAQISVQISPALVHFTSFLLPCLASVTMAGWHCTLFFFFFLS